MRIVRELICKPLAGTNKASAEKCFQELVRKWLRSKPNMFGLNYLILKVVVAKPRNYWATPAYSLGLRKLSHRDGSGIFSITSKP
jgi:hypothetical protein